MNKVVTIPFEEWVEKFKPISRKSDIAILLGDSFDLNDYLFETYGDDLKRLNEYKDELGYLHLWTYLSEGNMEWISNGVHYVNRMGYFVTREPAIENVAYDVDFGIDYDDFEDEEE
jgi:hypothetical protein